MRSVTKIGVKAATLGVLDAEDLEALKSIADDIADEAGTTTDEYIKYLLSRHGEEQKSIQGARVALSELSEALAGQKEDSNRLPLIFIVDELDRCKPPFALDLLEKIKHIFILFPLLTFFS